MSQHFEQTKTASGKSLVKNAFLAPFFLIFFHTAFAVPPPAIFWQVEAGEDQDICLGESAQLEANGASNYLWMPATGLSCTSCPNPVATPDATTLYVVMADDGTTDSVWVTVSLPPQINSVTFSDPADCGLPNGAIVVDATGAEPLEYSIDGGSTWSGTGTFTALPEGNYSVAVRNANGTCTVMGGDLQLNAPVPPSVLNVLANDPTLCDTPNGSIVISSAGGMSPLQYSIDAGQNWQGLNTFQLLGAGTYQIAVRNADGSCEVSGGTVVLTGSPDEAVITGIFSSGPSTCDASDGLITILVANDNGNFEYSINGGIDYQLSNAFPGLEEGFYHAVVRRLDGTCLTSGGYVELESSIRPNIFGTSVVDPLGCGTADGNITILAFGFSTLEFSIDGGSTWQGGNIFTNLVAGDYGIAVRNDDGTCLTEGGSVTLADPAGPEITGVSFSDPSACGLSDGSILIAASGGNPLEFSIDGGATWEANAQFTGLAGGTYEIAVRYEGGDCEISYALNPVNLQSPGNPPAIGNVAIVQPGACGQTNGSITIAATGNATLQYSIDGGTAYQSSNTFNNVGAGTYSIAVIETGGNCPATSSATLVSPGCTDTVQVMIPANTVTQVCLDSSVFDIQGVVTGAGFCDPGNAATVLAVSIDLECVELSPATGFAGLSPDLICTVHCFNNSASQCDTTYIAVTVEGQTSCDDVFPNDTLPGNFLGNPTSFCVPTALSELVGYDLQFNGQPLISPFDCDFEPKIAYSYTFLPGAGFNGPYFLEAWIAGGNTYTGFFNNANELADLMNVFDPTGNWQIDTQAGLIFGGNPNLQYGNMNVTHIPTGANAVMMTNLTFYPTGFTVGLAFPGVNVLIATDPVSGCSDTLYIDASFDPPVTEVVELTTVVNTPTGQFCLNGDELPGGTIVNVGYCGSPSNGAAPLAADTCVFYVPNLNFAGQDTFCVVVCDGGFPQFCDTTVFIVTVLPEVDTVFINIPAGETTADTCLSSFVIELPGGITSSDFCGINFDEITAGINDNCLTINVVNNFSGTTEICVVHCSGTVCDTNIVIVTVEPPIVCDEIFIQNSTTLTSVIDTGFLCIPVPTGDIGGYDVTVDGAIFSGPFTPCDFNDVVLYDYSPLPAGPYFIESWTANGTLFFGNAPDLAAVVDSLVTWDPAGGWTDNVFSQTIQGGVPGGNYSELAISQVGGNSFSLPVNLIQVPFGSQMSIAGFGPHEITVTAPNGCADTLTVTLEQHFTTNDTFYLSTPPNTPLTPLCGNTDDLLGNLQSLNFCGLPANGSVGQLNDTCIAYTPNLDYIGDDEICIVLCDDSQVPVCDTFVFVITVAPATDTLFITANVLAPFDTCLTGGVLQVPGVISTGEVCGANANEVDLAVNGICVTIDLADDFTGTTTACVVHCNSGVPAICDTTYLVITFDSTAGPCPEIFNPDQIFVSLDNNTGEVCLPVPVTDIGNFDILLDGNAYGGTLAACDFDSAYIYFYGFVFQQGSQGPYAVSWAAGGNIFTATVANIAELVDFMNDWDPAGDWVLVPATFAILSSNDLGMYGNLTITHIATGTVSNLAPDFNGIPAGTQITITGVGEHEIILVNTSDGCSDTLTVTALDGVDVLDIVTVENVPSQIECLDISGLPGNFVSIVICQAPLNGDLITSGNCFTFNPDNGFIGTDQGCLAVCDDLGNCDTTLLNITVDPLCSLFDFFPAGVQEFQVDDCTETATYCVPVLLDSMVNFGVLDNGFPYAGGFAPCNGSLTQITLDTGFHEIIFVHLNTGCQDTLLADVVCQFDSTGCGIAPLSPLDLVTVDCDSTVQFCVGIQILDLPNFLVTDNGQPFSGPVGACDLNSQFVGVRLDTGLHVLVFADTVKGCEDTFLVDVGCLLIEDVTVDVEVQVGSSEILCLEDFGIETSLIDSVQNQCPGNGNAIFELDETTWCVTVSGEIVGLDTACFKLFFGDTCAFFNVHATVTEPCPDLIPADLVGASIACSLDSGWVCLPVSPAAMADVVVSLDGTLYTEDLIPCDFDSIFTLSYTDLPSQGLLGPYILESWTVNGIGFTGVFNSAQELADSMNVWDPVGNWQVIVDPISQEILIIGGSPSNTYGVMFVEQSITQIQTDLALNTVFVPNGVAIFIPVGTFVLTLTDTVTQCTESLTVELACVEPDVVVDEILVGETDTFCLDLSELSGTWVTVTNVCPGSLGEVVNFSVQDSCVVYTGIEPGLDSACFVLCDDVGICDTTYFFITVLFSGDSNVVAVNDTVVTGQGLPTTINVLGNDLIVGINQFFILDPPLHGNALFLPDGSVNYVPEESFCDEVVPDSFTYVICNAIGCDTATVFVTVQCSGLEIFNAFSPNDDGVNDLFKITGLQNWPQHKLYIYNRWGNLIFEAENYQSDWDGVWNGKKVPDGTYFYVLDLGEGDKPMTGHLQIMR